MGDVADMDRYEKRAREITRKMNEDIRLGRLTPGSKEYEDLTWLIGKLFKASNTYKKD